MSNAASKGVEYSANGVCAPDTGKRLKFRPNRIIKSSPRKKEGKELTERTKVSSPTSIFPPLFQADIAPRAIPRTI